MLLHDLLLSTLQQNNFEPIHTNQQNMHFLIFMEMDGVILFNEKHEILIVTHVNNVIKYDV